MADLLQQISIFSSSRQPSADGAHPVDAPGLCWFATAMCPPMWRTGELGVVGYDVLKEHRLPVAQLVDLGFVAAAWRCELGEQWVHPCRDCPYRVASKFLTAPGNADAWIFPSIGALNGSVELGPITGMSEAIVDLVATGRPSGQRFVAIEDLFHSAAGWLAILCPSVWTVATSIVEAIRAQERPSGAPADGRRRPLAPSPSSGPLSRAGSSASPSSSVAPASLPLREPFSPFCLARR